MNPNQSMLASIKNSSNTTDLADKIGEVALDSLFSDGLLKDIPVIGTALSLFKAGNDVAAYFFAKKILAFMSEIEKIPSKKREEFVARYASSEETEHVGEVTLMLLDKIDHPSLAKLLGRSFVLMVNGVITRETFDIYAYAIKNLNTYLIRQIELFYQQDDIMSITPPAAVQLSNYGFVEISIIPSRIGNTKNMERVYERTEFGKFFYENVIKNA